MSIYIYSGEDLYREEKTFSDFLRKNKINKDQVVMIDGKNPKGFDMERVLLECDTLSLFAEENKVVVIRNPFFLNASSKESDTKANTNKKEVRLKQLESYLSHPNSSTTLIFYCHGFKADSRKKEYKLLVKYGAEVIEFTKMNEKEFQPWAIKELRKNNISLQPDAQNEFFERIGNDSLLFHQALLKLQLYGNTQYSLRDIRHLIPVNPDVNVFQLTTAFTKGDLSGCFEATREMLQANYDYPVLISMIAKRLRTIYNIKKLHEAGLMDEMIATRMHIKKGSVYYVLKDTTYLSSSSILGYLKELADLDQGIKQGNVSAKDGYEQFLIRNGSRKTGYR